MNGIAGLIVFIAGCIYLPFVTIPLAILFVVLGIVGAVLDAKHSSQNRR